MQTGFDKPIPISVQLKSMLSFGHSPGVSKPDLVIKFLDVDFGTGFEAALSWFLARKFGSYGVFQKRWFQRLRRDVPRFRLVNSDFSARSSNV
ncbi:MAG: hypothetical protein KDE20_00260 [Caldilineaceae bacterium]|nr:hypothetical protein [Caldilineaceae bacterium]